jgi:hypothetical protein
MKKTQSLTLILRRAWRFILRSFRRITYADQFGPHKASSNPTDPAPYELPFAVGRLVFRYSKTCFQRSWLIRRAHDRAARLLIKGDMGLRSANSCLLLPLPLVPLWLTIANSTFLSAGCSLPRPGIITPIRVTTMATIVSLLVNCPVAPNLPMIVRAPILAIRVSIRGLTSTHRRSPATTQGTAVASTQGFSDVQQSVGECVVPAASVSITSSFLLSAQY